MVGRSIRAILAGYLAMTLALGVLLFLVRMASGAEFDLTKSAPPEWFAFTSIGLAILCAVIGGFTTSALAPKSEIVHALVLLLFTWVFDIMRMYLGMTYGGVMLQINAAVGGQFFTAPIILLGGLAGRWWKSRGTSDTKTIISCPPTDQEP